MPGIGTGIFSLTKNQLLLLWNSKDRIQALMELQTRRANSSLSPQRIKDLAFHVTGSEEESDAVKCNYYHQNYKSSY